MRPFRRIITPDPNLKTVQDNVDAAVSDLQRHPELSASYIKVDVAPSQDIFVNHLLGRAYQNYIISNANADVRVWTSPTVNNSPERKLILQASGSASVTLKVW